MKPSPFDCCLETEIRNSSCEVCGDYKSSHEQYCDTCKEYKRLAEEKRKAKARAKAFGDIWK